MWCIYLLLFADSPSMIISFIFNNVPQKITMKLPLTINKFFEPTEMNGESFFARWKNLGGYVTYKQFNRFIRSISLSNFEFLNLKYFLERINNAHRRSSKRNNRWIWHKYAQNYKDLGCNCSMASIRIPITSSALVSSIWGRSKWVACCVSNPINKPRWFIFFTFIKILISWLHVIHILFCGII